MCALPPVSVSAAIAVLVDSPTLGGGATSLWCEVGLPPVYTWKNR